METVYLTKRELDGLAEYSCTVPTGTTIGKRWKRNDNAYRREIAHLDFWNGSPVLERFPPNWLMGEYAPDPKAKLDKKGQPETILIVWRKIVVREEKCDARSNNRSDSP